MPGTNQIHMSVRFKVLLFIVSFLFCNADLKAQDNDYLKHGKIFNVCSIKRNCSHCQDCNKERFQVKIKDNSGKKIRQVFYKFYSPVFNKILEKEAKMVGDKIDAMQTGLVYVCVFDDNHWIFSKLVYDDGTEVNFTLHSRLENFIQEADECDCND